MKFTYRLCGSQDLPHPAFFNAPPLNTQQKHGALNRLEINRAVDQLNAGADVIVIATDDILAMTLLVYDLTSKTVRVSTTDASRPIPLRSIPGHLFVLFSGKELPHKIW